MGWGNYLVFLINYLNWDNFSVFSLPMPKERGTEKPFREIQKSLENCTCSAIYSSLVAFVSMLHRNARQSMKYVAKHGKAWDALRETFHRWRCGSKFSNKVTKIKEFFEFFPWKSFEFVKNWFWKNFLGGEELKKKEIMEKASKNTKKRSRGQSFLQKTSEKPKYALKIA